jgi:hypothetical protein
MSRKRSPESGSSQKKVRRRYGIGEWYGKVFTGISQDERSRLAELQFLSKKDRPMMPCPFRENRKQEPVVCTKIGGVCSLRLYQVEPSSSIVTAAHGVEGAFVTTCPHRFKEAGRIYSWIGETLLSNPNPLVAAEVGFLKRSEVSSGEAVQKVFEDVGRIDNVLVDPSVHPAVWCALELQAVYFSGSAMKKEFEVLRSWKSAHLAFPSAHRRPDFRSSGPKRLMPQLQIKVPTLRRWGKKMAVVVDRSFFDSLGIMEEVSDLSSCDIAWFVVKYEESTGGNAILERDAVKLTTLERAVEALTGGTPLSLPDFEVRIHAKLAAKF